MTTKQASMNVRDIARWGHDIDSIGDYDAWTQEWEDCKAKGETWGGRSRGGRGVRVSKGRTRDIHVSGVTMQFAGHVLLDETELILKRGRKYGLVGHNGVGKSTLLRRLAKQAVPGVPTHFKMVYMQQELAELPNTTAREYLQSSTNSFGEKNKLQLQEREKQLNEQLETTTDSDEISYLAECLADVSDELDKVEKGDYDEKDFSEDQKVILEGLGLLKKDGSSTVLDKQMNDLSGGWRVRIVLAASLIEATSRLSDVLLLDEPSNHLDLKTNDWLRQYLTDELNHLIIVLVSHDRGLLESVCSDIIEMRDQKLEYFSGTYEEWLEHNAEMRSFHENRQDGQRRRDEHIKKSGAGQDVIKKKLERNAMHRGIDGKKFKNFSLKKLSEDHLHLAEIEASTSRSAHNKETHHINHFKFPPPDLASLRLVSPDAPLLQLDSCEMAWMNPDPAIGAKTILSNVTLQICSNSKIAVVGLNGQGKSTLMSALLACSDLSTAIPSGSKLESSSTTIESSAAKPIAPKTSDSMKRVVSIGAKPKDIKSSIPVDEDIRYSSNGSLRIKGKLTSHRNLRIGILSQHHIDAMADHLDSTPLQYLQSRAVALGGAAKTLSEFEGRAHLGRFGLSGPVVTQVIASLSGGQKARLTLAIACLFGPHILLLDEPTNHLSIDAIEALIEAIKAFEGAIVTISHNQWFLEQTCNRLLVVKKGCASFLDAIPSTGPTASKGKGKSSEPIAQSGAMGHQTFQEILGYYISSQTT